MAIAAGVGEGESLRIWRVLFEVDDEARPRELKYTSRLGYQGLG